MNAVHPLPDPWARAPVLRAHLEPIWSYLNEDAVSEIAINRPGELFIERLGAKEMEHVVKREVTPGWIRHISTGVASAAVSAADCAVIRAMNSATPVAPATCCTEPRMAEACE